MPYHMAGTHRRIKFQDLVAYKAVSEKRRREIMEELAAPDLPLSISSRWS